MKTLIANWKMNPASIDEAVALMKEIALEGVIVCPPFPYIGAVRENIGKAGFGAQDSYWEEKGAYTSAISPTQLFSLGVGYVMLGHSERRAYFKETYEDVAKKVAAVLKAQMSPIICIGENREEKKAGKTEEVIEKQLTTALSQLPENINAHIFLAYEPVWAISTNMELGDEGITPEGIQKEIQFMKRLVSEKFSHIMDHTSFIYGGSINKKNIHEIFSLEEVEEGLVGGASLHPEEFKKMVEIRNQLNN